MTRKEYLHKLHSYLRNLPEEEVEDLLIYFEELLMKKGSRKTIKYLLIMIAPDKLRWMS